MGIESKIQWTEATWNPWHGCTKVSTGCKYCYMYRDKERYKKDPTEVIRSTSNFNAPLKWKEPKLIFTCSWSDVFIEAADKWRDEFWAIIKATPHHTYQILTKRPERILECLPADWGEGYDNVWMGISAENDEMFLTRMKHFSKIKAKVKFISAEPLLGPINFSYVLEDTTLEGNNRIDWVIIGGESGNDHGKYRYRECELAWIDDIVIDCFLYNIPVFVKQLGTHISKTLGLKDRHGGNIDEWPKKLGHWEREMPLSYDRV